MACEVNDIMILSIAWKNVWRNKARSLVVIIAVTLGLFGGIFSMGIMNGMQEQVVNSSIKTEISNIQIHNPKFLANKEVKFTIEDVKPKLKYIENLPQVKATCKRIKATAMASTAITGTGVLINGVIPEQEKRVTNLWRKISKGSYFETKTRVAPVVIGEKLASKLKAEIRSKIVVTIQNMDATITYGALRVVGIYKTQDSNFDKRMIFVKNEDLLNLIGLPSSQTSEIAILLDNNDETDAVTTKLKQKVSKFRGAILENYSAGTGNDVCSNATDELSFSGHHSSCSCLCNHQHNAHGGYGTDAGNWYAHGSGYEQRKVFSMIMVETIFLSLVGGVCGIIISLVTIDYFGEHGINFAVVSKGLSSLGYASIAYPVVSLKFYFIIGIMVVITAIISSFYPAHKALALDPATAIRMEE